MMDAKLQELEQELQNQETYLLYGAGVVAYEIYVAIRQLYGKEPRYVLVTAKETSSVNMPSELEVQAPENLSSMDWQLPVVVAVPEIYHEQIMQTLEKHRIRKVFYVDAHMEYLLTSAFYRQIHCFPLVEDLEEPEGGTPDWLAGNKQYEQIHVFMAKSHRDKILKGRYSIPSWVEPIQAGYAVADQDLGILADNTGDNISVKNANYCELTITYWVWKNVRSRYKGICHYRRMLLFTEKQLNQCVTGNIDVILPLPFTCYPNAAGQYGRYISRTDCERLKNGLQDVAPEYLSEWEKLDRQPYYYDYNMLIAKEEVFDSYCQWLFGILGQTEKYCESNGVRRADRYAGYLGELLTTLYFMKHREQLKIVHAERNWMV